MRIAEVEGCPASAFNELVPVLKLLKIDTLKSLLESGVEEWNEIERYATDVHQLDAAVRLRAAISTLTDKCIALEKAGKKMPIDFNRIGMQTCAFSTFVLNQNSLSRDTNDFPTSCLASPDDIFRTCMSRLS